MISGFGQPFWGAKGLYEPEEQEVCDFLSPRNANSTTPMKYYTQNTENECGENQLLKMTWKIFYLKKLIWKV